MFPIEFDGLKLSLWDNYPTIDAKNIYEEIPTWFWMFNIYYDIPSYKSNRKKLTNQLYDQTTRTIVTRKVSMLKLILLASVKFVAIRWSTTMIGIVKKT